MFYVSCRFFRSFYGRLTGTVFINGVKPKSAYWHFNTDLLNDGHFRQCFIYLWSTWKLEKAKYSSLQQWWDIGKIKIQKCCNQGTFNVTRDTLRSIKDLEIGIVELQTIYGSTGDRGQMHALKAKKAKLADLLGIKAQGALIRSRFQNIAEMDAPSRFFFNLEKKNGQSRLIHCLRSADGCEFTESSDIRRRAAEFFSKLYTCEYSDNPDGLTLFLSNLPQISEQKRAEMGQPISMQELTFALEGMKKGRAPGIDGIPVEFFKAFWSFLGEDLLAVLNDSMEKGCLPLSCRRAVLTLLPKKGDTCEVKNWRPVSLLCTDYKIISKALANRLRDVMDQVVHVDQSYCVPGRSIRDNIVLIRDYLDISNSLDLQLGFISLDQEKAFDRVEHQYLLKVLEAFGFSPGFIAMIRVLYSEVESVLKVNGGLSAPFSIGRGIRQGCSVSGMLYSIAIEPLLCRLRKEMRGVRVVDGIAPFLLSAYADDVIVAIREDSDVQALTHIVELYGKISSSKVNWAKSTALIVGKWQRERPKLPEGLLWVTNGIKYLGVHLGDESMAIKNWEGVVERMQGTFKKWRWLLPRMSFRGRTIIANNLVAPVLWHRLSVLDPPAGLLVRIQGIILDFFWDKLHWIPQDVLYLSKEEGGQGLVHLESRKGAFRLEFFKSLLYGPPALPWRPVAELILGRVGNLNFGREFCFLDSLLCECF
jgi:hypothetical protein